MAKRHVVDPDGNGKPDQLRNRRATPRTAAAAPGPMVRLDTTPMEGRTQVYFENQGPNDLRWALADADAGVPVDFGVLAVGDFRSFLAAEDVALYGAVAAGAAAVFIEEIAR